jgi:crotonobetainyl-CoA:carnitine CoA-transferase CaiB-like acyl-CoA transferase
MTEPLAGIRVLDAASFVAGPLAASLLADLGADVVKLEPATGDPLRRIGGVIDDEFSATFAAVNRGKRAVALDLSDERNRARAAALAAASTIVIHNQRPAAAERLGLAAAPVLVAISAFGNEGPYAERPALDPIVQAMSGIAAITGEPDGEPRRAGAPVVDIATALCAGFGALAALRAHERTGDAKAITVSLFEIGLLLNSSAFAMRSVHGRPLERLGNASHALLAEQFAAADGLVWLAVWEDGQWSRLCDLLDLGELADDAAFASNALRVENQHRLVPLVAGAMASRRAEEIRSDLEDAGIPTAITLELDDVGEDPHVRAIEAIRTESRLPGPDLSIPAGPLRIDGVRPDPGSPAPRLGQHSAEILAELEGA